MKMNNTEHAISIVELAKNEGYEAPQKTEFYIWYAGRICGKHRADGFYWNQINTITRKDWQDAKALVYGNNFGFQGYEDE
jgi:hypothetical protein